MTHQVGVYKKEKKQTNKQTKKQQKKKKKKKKRKRTHLLCFTTASHDPHSTIWLPATMRHSEKVFGPVT